MQPSEARRALRVAEHPLPLLGSRKSSASHAMAATYSDGHPGERSRIARRGAA